jgi:hypothetical protein
MRKYLFSAVVLAAFPCLIGSEVNAANLVLNPSFEESGPATTLAEAVGSTDIPHWTVVGGGDGVAWIKSPDFSINAPDGSYSIDLTGFSNGAPFGGVQQTITTVSGATYQLSFSLGIQNIPGTFSINAAAGSTQSTIGLTPSGNTGAVQFFTEGFGFVADGTSTLLTLLGVSSGGVQEYIGLDSVDVEFVHGPDVAAVPIPGALPLFASGLAGLGWLARRRRKQAA